MRTFDVRSIHASHGEGCSILDLCYPFPVLNHQVCLLQVLTPADDIHHINKHNFKVPFVCGCRDLGEALRRIAEGAAMIRTKGEAGTGNVVEAVRHTRSVTGAIRQLQTLDEDELYVYAKEIRAPVDLVRKTKHLGRSVLALACMLHVFRCLCAAWAGWDLCYLLVGCCGLGRVATGSPSGLSIGCSVSGSRATGRPFGESVLI